MLSKFLNWELVLWFGLEYFVRQFSFFAVNKFLNSCMSFYRECMGHLANSVATSLMKRGWQCARMTLHFSLHSYNMINTVLYERKLCSSTRMMQCIRDTYQAYIIIQGMLRVVS